MAITIDLVFEDGHTKQVAFDPDRISLRTLARMQKAQTSTGQWDELIPIVAGMLHLTDAEAGDLTIAQFREITAALGGAATVPNESAPSTDG